MAYRNDRDKGGNRRGGNDGTRSYKGGGRDNGRCDNGRCNGDNRSRSSRDNKYRENDFRSRTAKNTERPERQGNPREDFAEDSAVGLIIGRNPVMEALRSGKAIDTVYVNSAAGGSIGAITRIARERGIVVKAVTDKKLTEMCGETSHQGIIASGACAEYVSIEDILAISKKKGTAPFIIICDEIEDPHNLGAVIRTAEAAGADGVIIPKRRSASLNATVYKTSAGAASWLPVARTPNLAAAIEELKKAGVWIFGTDMDGDDYTKADFTGAVALVIGSEGDGMGRLVTESCDFLVSIPMRGKLNSLNASAAAAVLMYEVLRQRN
ncbi:MAG: 23S rRNA (guanosine(2251)-2'-O)-methyltransferase RlmB [Oscillospiraceae bacterium]|nr:23S rRNA (guanosine(2251)-2'-O)-methyltransferase RlmB [Oscillospiraceae bacterium]